MALDSVPWRSTRPVNTFCHQRWSVCGIGVASGLRFSSRTEHTGVYVRNIRILTLLLALAAGFGIAGCPGFGDELGPIASVPDFPQYSVDVRPLLDRYCNECHSSPPAQGAPGYLRLDVCEDQGGILGARSQADRSASRTAQVKTMPPASYSRQPTQIERDILQRWAETGAPCTGSGSTNDGTDTSTNNMTTPSNTMTTNNQTTVMGAPFSAIVGILGNGCGLSSCHGIVGGYGGFEISANPTEAEARAALEGKNTFSGKKLVDPGNPANSRIYTAMSSNAADRMPPTGNLPDAQVEAVRTWILSGAPYQ